MTDPYTIEVDDTSQRFDGNPQPTPEILLLHTTEVWGWPGYRDGKDGPHATIQPVPNRGIRVRQHRPWTDYGKSLANEDGGVETNRRGVIQLELMGTCDPRRGDVVYLWPDADDVVLAALAAYCRPLLRRFEIPAQAIADFVAYPASYGRNAPQRLSGAEWNRARGICGHQHAPENDHGDPGAFPIARFLTHLSPEEDDDMNLTDQLRLTDAQKRTLNLPDGATVNDALIAGIIARQRTNRILTLLDEPDDLAKEIAAALPAGVAVDDAQLTRVLRSILGSLDDEEATA